MQIYILGLVAFIPVNQPNTYLTLTLRSLGFSTVCISPFFYGTNTNTLKFNTNLLTIPSTVAGIITLIGVTLFSEWVNERSFVGMIQPLWALPCLIVLRFWPGMLQDSWGTYAVITVLLSYPYVHAIFV